MKVIIIEGPDNTGKNTLIQSIIDNNQIVKLVHCAKPKDKVNPFKEQCETFSELARVAVYDYKANLEDVLVYNRFYQGEYVYGQMYRNGNRDAILAMMYDIEEYLLSNIGKDNIYYVQLVSTSNKLLKKNDDGLSLSNADEEKISEENELFEEVFANSMLKKHIIYINEGDNFRTREDILLEFNDFINRGY